MHGQVPEGHSYTVYRWNDNGGNEVQEYWLINGMGHAWSGGNPGDFTDLQGPSASLAMCMFFKNHPMRECTCGSHIGLNRSCVWRAVLLKRGDHVVISVLAFIGVHVDSRRY